MSKIDEILDGYNNGQLTYIDREGEHKISVKEFVKTGGFHQAHQSETRLVNMET